jgi:hypothetical protein
MIIKRRRFKQATNLEEKLAEAARQAREQAERLPAGSKREALLQKARGDEAAADKRHGLAQRCAATCELLHISDRSRVLASGLPRKAIASSDQKLAEELLSNFCTSISLMESKMISPPRCRELADYYKSLSRGPSISPDRAFLLKNIARTFTGLSGQLDRLAALTRDEKQVGSRPS